MLAEALKYPYYIIKGPLPPRALFPGQAAPPVQNPWRRPWLEPNIVFRCRGSDPYDSFQKRYTGREKRGDHDGEVHFTLHLKL